MDENDPVFPSAEEATPVIPPPSRMTEDDINVAVARVRAAQQSINDTLDLLAKEGVVCSSISGGGRVSNRLAISLHFRGRIG